MEVATRFRVPSIEAELGKAASSLGMDQPNLHHLVEIAYTSNATLQFLNVELESFKFCGS
jgi:hypothetical protein